MAVCGFVQQHIEFFETSRSLPGSPVLDAEAIKACVIKYSHREDCIGEICRFFELVWEVVKDIFPCMLGKSVWAEARITLRNYEVFWGTNSPDWSASVTQIRRGEGQGLYVEEMGERMDSNLRFFVQLNNERRGRFDDGEFNPIESDYLRTRLNSVNSTCVLRILSQNYHNSQREERHQRVDAILTHCFENLLLWERAYFAAFTNRPHLTYEMRMDFARRRNEYFQGLHGFFEGVDKNDPLSDETKQRIAQLRAELTHLSQLLETSLSTAPA